MKTTKYDMTFKTSIKLSDKKLQKILQFYLIECPVEGVSFKGKSFKEYGYADRNSFGRLKKQLLDSATSSLAKNYFPSLKSELENNIKECSLKECSEEYCVFLKSDEKSVMRSLFSAIRNALAHGRFSIKTYKNTHIYCFSNYKKYEKARIVLYEDTLLTWIKIIKNEGVI